jgi:hypothetical protein
MILDQSSLNVATRLERRHVAAAWAGPQTKTRPAKGSRDQAPCVLVGRTDLNTARTPRAGKPEPFDARTREMAVWRHRELVGMA